MNAAYPGLELDLFAAAVNWKGYLGACLAPHIGGRVAEIGGGIGSNIPFLITSAVTDWLSVEPDPTLASRLARRIAENPTLVRSCRSLNGTLADIPATERFDTILYIDVLEHIEDDRAEVARATARLAPGGRLIVLAPAHQFLFSPFDRAIGHYRRYDRRALAARTASPLPARYYYLDSVGLLASLANRMLLRSAHPTARQIGFWDRVLVPVSRHLDPLFGRRVGKSLVGIWTAP